MKRLAVFAVLVLLFSVSAGSVHAGSIENSPGIIAQSGFQSHPTSI
jgi:hypothetical protein